MVRGHKEAVTFGVTTKFTWRMRTMVAAIICITLTSVPGFQQQQVFLKIHWVNPLQLLRIHRITLLQWIWIPVQSEEYNLDYLISLVKMVREVLLWMSRFLFFVWKQQICHRECISTNWLPIEESWKQPGWWFHSLKSYTISEFFLPKNSAFFDQWQTSGNQKALLNVIAVLPLGHN